MEEMNEDEQDIFINQLMNDVDRYKDIIDEQINFIGVIKQENSKLKEQISMYQKWINLRNTVLEKFFNRNGLTIHDLEEFENERTIGDNKQDGNEKRS